ncbi:hypothetical protein [Paenibacillus medicaginis]|uniref:Uncharacterized protein n=1 Tax=Paenibacillus medicaginis TaxID=1470560 RepID=A0ABV5BXL0_9BACL
MKLRSACRVFKTWGQEGWWIGQQINFRCLCIIIPFDPVTEKQINLGEEPYLVKEQVGSGS